MTKSSVDLRITLLLLCLLGSLVLYHAFRTHALSDDYCHALHWKTASGWYEYTRTIWEEWSGRWAATVLRYFFYELIGLDAGGYWLVAVISMCAILAGFFFATQALYGSNVTSLIWGLICSVIFIAVASAIDSLLFWMTGLTDYTLGYLFTPLSLWLGLNALSERRQSPGWWLPAAGIALFWACGFSEMFLFPIWFFLSCGLVVSTRKGCAVFLCLFALAGTLLSVLAPGNTQRASAQTLDPGWIEIAWGTLFYGLRGLLLPVAALAIVSSLPFMARSVLALASLVQKSLGEKQILAIASFAMIYPFAIEFVLFWNLGAPGPGRVHNISLFGLILAWPFLLAAAKQKLAWSAPVLPRYGKLLVQLLAVGLLFFVNPYKMSKTIANGSAAQHHRELARAEKFLTLPENQGKDIILPTADLVSHDQNHWVNKCVADYFSVNTVRASDGELEAQ